MHAYESRQPGYSEWMTNSYRFIGLEMDKRTTVDMWCEAHSLVMTSSSKAGQLRQKVSTRKSDELNYPDDCLAEISGMNPRMCDLEKVDGSYQLTARVFDEATMRANLESTLDQYYDRIDTLGGWGRDLHHPHGFGEYHRCKDGTETKNGNDCDENSDFEKIEAISRLHQTMMRIEPNRDGNSRVSLLFLNKHLIEAGYSPCIFVYPDRIPFMSLQEVVMAVLNGMDLWRELGLQNDPVAANAQKIPDVSDQIPVSIPRIKFTVKNAQIRDYLKQS